MEQNFLSKKIRFNTTGVDLFDKSVLTSSWMFYWKTWKYYYNFTVVFAFWLSDLIWNNAVIQEYLQKFKTINYRGPSCNIIRNLLARLQGVFLQDYRWAFLQDCSGAFLQNYKGPSYKITGGLLARIVTSLQSFVFDVTCLRWRNFDDAFRNLESPKIRRHKLLLGETRPSGSPPPPVATALSPQTLKILGQSVGL